MKRKRIGIILTAILVCSFYNEIDAGADDSSVQHEVVEIRKESDLENLAMDTHTIIFADESINEYKEDKLNELLDDGIQILDFSSKADEIYEVLNTQILGEDENVIGYKITKDGENIKVATIDFELVCDNEDSNLSYIPDNLMIKIKEEIEEGYMQHQMIMLNFWNL